MPPVIFVSLPINCVKAEMKTGRNECVSERLSFRQ